MSQFFTELGIDPGIVIIILAVLIVIMAVIIIQVIIRLSRLEKRYKIFMSGKDGPSLEEHITDQVVQINKLTERNEQQLQDMSFLSKSYGALFSKYGVEKYDAFENIGGKLSFVLALLDRSNTGIILNAVHSRDNCFLYLKEIVKGESYVMLSQEEVEALRKAVNFDLEENDK